MRYLGDFPEDATVNFLWHTTDASGASITRSADGTIHVYKDVAGGTEVTTGITNVEDFDSLTGIHSCTIDLSSAGFYATGGDYTVVLKAATIDGQTVNAVLASFSIENRFQEVDLVKWLGTTPQTLTSQRVNVRVAAMGSGVITAGVIASNAITAAKIAANAIGASELAADAIGSSQLADSARDKIADGVWDEDADDHVTTDSMGAYLQAGIIFQATIASGGDSLIGLGGGALAVDDIYNGTLITIFSGTGDQQTRQIIDYSGTARIAGVEPPFTTAVAIGDRYIIHAGVSANAVADAIMRMTTATIEAAIDGVPDKRTLYGVLAGMTHKRTRDGSNIVLYKANDSDILTTIPILTDDTLDPIDQIDPGA